MRSAKPPGSTGSGAVELGTIESELDGLWQRSLEELMRQCIENGIQNERQILAQNIVFRMTGLLQQREPSQTVVPTKNWIQIESLSKLRAVVGGRLELLKKRWVGAGFPLRQHRADRTLDWSLDEEGWNALSLWLDSQGYSVRLLQDQKGGFFEVCSEDSPKV
jgi:hypothetical protein